MIRLLIAILALVAASAAHAGSPYDHMQYETSGPKEYRRTYTRAQAIDFARNVMGIGQRTHESYPARTWCHGCRCWRRR